MSHRFTLTEKWSDSWFRRRKPAEKLIFLYLCDACDIAGFWEVDIELAAFHTGLPAADVEGALKGLARGLEGGGDWVWLRNFLKCQKNIPLNINNNAHVGIMRSFEAHKPLPESILKKIEEFKKESPFKAPFKGLSRGIGKGIGKGKRGSVRGADEIDQQQFDSYCRQMRTLVEWTGRPNCPFADLDGEIADLLAKAQDNFNGKFAERLRAEAIKARFSITPPPTQPQAAESRQ